MAERVAGLGLELDDLGAEVGELERQHVAGDQAGEVEHAQAVERAGLLGVERGRGQTVAIGVTGEPTAPGRRSGGAVRRKRWRPCSRSQAASSVR